MCTEFGEETHYTNMGLNETGCKVDGWRGYQ
jgi:hypothetical protein